MPKRIVAKTGEYMKDGETKANWTEVGVILSGEHGDYILLNPEVNLAGLLIKQRILNPKKESKAVLCNIFDNEPRQQSKAQANNPPDEFNDDIPF